MSTVNELLKRFSHLPRFADGRINYTGSESALVLTCFVLYNGKILLLKRSNTVLTYRGVWNTVAGYMDEDILPEEKATEELLEETGIMRDNISSITAGVPLEFRDGKRTWIVIPVLARLVHEPAITLDHEHTTYRWVTPEDTQQFDTVPNFAAMLRIALAL